MAAACGEGRARVWWGRCFIDDRRGSAAVEFGILAIPFFLLVFAIIEVALQFFVAEILDTATSQAARLIRTGEAYHAGLADVEEERADAHGLGCPPGGRLPVDQRHDHRLRAAQGDNLSFKR